MAPIDRLSIRVTKTANGQHEYVQIMSGDNFTVNVVLIAHTIEIEDSRPKQKKGKP
mgnify:CR=1 FL=1|jgi:hypothetical protein